MSRIKDTFTRLRSEKQTGLVTFVTAGDPDMDRSGVVLDSIDQAGADVLEIGVPFSDPLADGPVIQRSAERALRSGATLASTLDLIERLRPRLSAEVVVFSYVNPLLAMGFDTFAMRAADAGVDGVLVLDLPIEEAEDLRESVCNFGIDPIFLLSPTTTRDRIQRAADLGGGFLYGISRLGVTGERETVAAGAKELVERIRQVTSMPLALGFGISRPEHVVEVGRWADAAVVGSGLVKTIAGASDGLDLAGEVYKYVRWLKGESG